MRLVGGHELGIGFHEGGQERDVAAETVELGDQQGGAALLAVDQGCGQFGAIAVGLLAALDLGVGPQDGPAGSLGVCLGCGLLRIQTEPAGPLAGGTVARRYAMNVGLFQTHWRPLLHTPERPSGGM
jgi:hypothetical protein